MPKTLLSASLPSLRSCLMPDYPMEFSDKLQNLSSDMASASVDHISSRGFEVRLGLTPEYAEQIIKMAREPAIQEYCPNDIGSRFADMQATVQWLSKGRAVFLLLTKAESGNDGVLAGYGWVGQGDTAHVPDGETTFAIRIGEIGQGQGLAEPFSRLMIEAATNLFSAKNIWLETWASNGAAVHVYHKVGFEDVASEASERPTADGGRVADTRLYMSLPNEKLNG
jgi:ribosomal protein S18 acetylase RimI-like enzyme